TLTGFFTYHGAATRGFWGQNGFAGRAVIINNSTTVWVVTITTRSFTIPELTVGREYHLAVTYSAADECNVFLNGQASSSNPVEFPELTGDVFRLRNLAVQNSEFSTITLRDCRVYNADLTQSQVQAVRPEGVDARRFNAFQNPYFT